MDGDLDELIDALVTADQAEQLQNGAGAEQGRRRITMPGRHRGRSAAGVQRDRGEEICRHDILTCGIPRVSRRRSRIRFSPRPRSCGTGGLVGIPTETVYGLGANALDGTAVKRIFEAKGRPQDNPLIIHVTGAQWLPRYCADVPPLAYVLARKFWPGPLTMILKRRPIIPDETTAGLDTVAVRCPNHPVTLAIIREAGIPIAAPAPTLSGRPSCTTAQDVLEDMDGKDQRRGGRRSLCGGCGVHHSGSDLRPAPAAASRRTAPGGPGAAHRQDRRGQGRHRRPGGGEKPKAPGMKYRHYAPRRRSPWSPARRRSPPRRSSAGGAHLRRSSALTSLPDLFPEQEVHTLGPVGDKLVQAQRVFDALRTF